MLRFFTRKQCKKAMEMSAIVLLMATVATQAAGTPTQYIEKAIYASGAANVSPANGGEYVYGGGRADGRIPVKALLTGPVERQSYVYFTPDEERLLLSFRDRQLAKVVKAKLLKERTHFVKVRSVQRRPLNWPKVVLRGNEICVPELASSDAADWKDHLTCFQSKDQH